MFCSRLSLLAVILVAIAAASDADDLPCSKMFRCSNSEDVTWATDGHTCKVFRNPCHLANENCHRQNNYEEELATLDQDECQEMCPQMCTMMFLPVCGEYNGKRKTFSNRCMMDVHVCNSGETFSLFNAGACPAEEEEEGEKEEQPESNE